MPLPGAGLVLTRAALDVVLREVAVDLPFPGVSPIGKASVTVSCSQVTMVRGGEGTF